MLSLSPIFGTTEATTVESLILLGDSCESNLALLLESIISIVYLIVIGFDSDFSNLNMPSCFPSLDRKLLTLGHLFD